MNERTIMIGEHLSGEYSIAELARRRGVSRKTAYKWIERYEKAGVEGLEERSRAAHSHPNEITKEMEERILWWKEQRPGWGAPKIHSKLVEYADCPSESTVSNVLRRHGLTRPVRRRWAASPSVGPLENGQGPNEVWSVDFKGWFLMGNGSRCDPLTISDQYSRYLLCCQGIEGGTGTRTVKGLFIRTCREYGLPDRIRSDNGAPFASRGLGGLTALAVWWMRLGIQLERIEPGQPQQNGRHERLHRTLKAAVLKPPSWSLQQQQKAFDAFRRDYNQERPHEALGQKPPASVYQPSKRAYPERLPEVHYPCGWHMRRVSPGGQLKWRGFKVYLSDALVDQVIGLEPVDDGLWRIHFMSLELGQLDERKECIIGRRNL